MLYNPEIARDHADADLKTRAVIEAQKEELSDAQKRLGKR
jgi:hypothetical protein